MKPTNESFFIFVWYHPDNQGIASEIVGKLHKFGLEFNYNQNSVHAGDFSFNSIEWWLSQSELVVFLLSESALKSPNLQDDIKKVLRHDRGKLIPVILDDGAANNLPLLLRFFPNIDYRIPGDWAVSELVGSVREKLGLQSEHSSKGMVYLKLPLTWVIEHFRTYLIKPPLTFCWQITVENLIVSMMVTGLIQFYFQTSSRTNLDALGAVSFLWLVVILSPIVETILLQAFPVLIARKFGLKYWGQILFSAVPFAVLHFSRSISAGIGAGIVGGFYSAFTYVHWWDESSWTAFWVTALSHGLYNFAIFAMLIGEF